MTAQQMVGMAVRLFAIWLLFNALTYIISGVQLSGKESDQDYVNIFCIIGVTGIVLAAVLWCFPMAIAHKLIPRTHYEDKLCVPVSEATTVACVILGLWLFINHVLPGLADYVSKIFVLRLQGIPLTDSQEFTASRISSLIFKLAVAMMLCFKASTVSRFLVARDKSPDKE